MNLDLTVAPGQVESTCRRQVATLSGPTVAQGGYLTGGITVDPTEVRMGKIFAILGGVLSNGTAMLLPWYDVATGKLLYFVPNTGAEVANATDLTAYSGRVEFVGQ